MKRNTCKRWLSMLLCLLMVLSLCPLTAGAETAAVETTSAEVDQLTPDEMTFRKVWTQRNMFNTELLLDAAELPEGGWALSNETENELSEQKEIGMHTPYGLYDITVSEQDIGTSAGLLLKKDDNSYITIEQSRKQIQAAAEIYSTDFSDAEYYASLAQYHDDGQKLTISQTENGTVRFDGVSAGRGESFVQLTDSVRQGIRYEVDITSHNGASYNNMIFKLRNKTDGTENIWFVQRVGNGTCTLDGRIGGSIITNGTTFMGSNSGGVPYTMSMEIKGGSIVFSRKHGDTVDFSQEVDMSAQLDLTDPEILANYEICVGGRMDNNHNLEIGAFRMYDCRTEMDFTESDLLDLYQVTHYDAQPLTVSYDANGLNFAGNSAGRGESYVELGTAKMGAKYSATVGALTGGYNNQCIYIDYPAGELYFVNRVTGGATLSCSSDATFSHTLSGSKVAAPYTVSIEFKDTGAVFSQEKDGAVVYSQYIDLSSIMDLTDPDEISQITVNAGGRMDPGCTLTYSEIETYWGSDGVESGENEEDAITGELVLKSYVDGKLAVSRVLREGEFKLPYTIRADFSAKTELNSTYTGIGYVNVWVVENGKATLVNGGRHDIDLLTDFSNPEITAAYTAYASAAAAPGSSVKVTEAKHCLTGGAGQADPKVIHDEKGQVIIEDNKVWLAMSTRGYSNRSSYQGIYCLDLDTYDLDLVGSLSFNICTDGVRRYAQNHASDIIYNSMADEWIVYCGCDVNTAQIFCGLLPGDPREGGLMFVDVEHVSYTGSTNGEEDPSLIYDEEAGKWRLVMCNHQSGTGYQIPLYESDTWNGDFVEIARYATGPCTGNLIRMVDGKFYVFSGRGTDNMEAISYPEMTKLCSLYVESSPKSYNVWPSILPVPNEETGETRYFLLTFDREQHSVASNYSSHNYGNLYLYESVQVAGRAAQPKDAAVENLHPIVNGVITSAQQLAQIRNDLSGNYTLGADIDLSAIENWVPIGTEEEPFTGTLDGNGHIITGMNSDRGTGNAAGLFGSIASGASVKNLAIKDSSVSGYIYVGLLAGKNYGVIENCAAEGIVNGFSAAGGLVGQNNGKITNSYTSGTVNGTGGDSVGGFVGVNTANVGTVDLANKGVITNSKSDAVVIGYVNVGGFVGQNDCGTLTNCVAEGDVTGISFVGGLVGRSGLSYGNGSAAPITNCHAIGDVTGEIHVGGLAGYNDGTISQSFAAGSTVTAVETAGGLIGWNNNHAKVVASYTTATIGDGVAAGSMVGENYGIVTNSASTTIDDVFGNCELTVMEGTAPDLLTAAVYTDILTGYTASAWSVADGAYPQLTTLPTFDEEVDSVEMVIAQIDSIVIEDLTIDSKEMMEMISGNYDALSEEEKALVTNYDKLLEAKEAFAVILANDPTEQAKAAAEAAKAAQAAAETAQAAAEAAQAKAEAAKVAAEEAAASSAENKEAAEAAQKAAEEAKAVAEAAKAEAEAAQKAAEDAAKAAEESDASAALEAQKAAEEAAKAAASAELAAGYAADSAEALAKAQAAQAAAEAAQKAAEDAQGKSEAAQKAAEDAQAKAEAAQKAVKDAQAKVDAAQKEVDAAQKDVEAAKQAVEAAQKEAEAAQAAAEAAQKEAEAAKAEAEAAKKEAEEAAAAAKKEAEELAAEAEAAKKAAELAAEKQKVLLKLTLNAGSTDMDAMSPIQVDSYKAAMDEAMDAVDAAESVEDLEDIIPNLESAVDVIINAASANRFVDVIKGDWFYDVVDYVAFNGIMTGMDETHFGPYEALSRGQFALILYRMLPEHTVSDVQSTENQGMEGEPEVVEEITIPDIVGDEWYADAVLWARASGIVTGYEDGNYGPADLITREQMAVMMYRYAEYLEKDVETESDYSAYADAELVSEFAAEAMKWATGKQIITGKEEGTLLDPQGNTTRAEAAAIIQRFLEM